MRFDTLGEPDGRGANTSVTLRQFEASAATPGSRDFFVNLTDDELARLGDFLGQTPGAGEEPTMAFEGLPNGRKLQVTLLPEAKVRIEITDDHGHRASEEFDKEAVVQELGNLKGKP